MPEIVYTPAQQAQISINQTAVTNATNAVEGYKARITTAYDNMKNLFGGQYLSSGCYRAQPTLEAQLNGYGKLNEQSCKSNHGDCKHCKRDVQLFNTEVDNWMSAKASLVTAQANLASALKNQSDYLAGLSRDPNIASQKRAIEDKAKADAATSKRKFIFWTASILVAGLLIFAWIKWGHKVSA